MSITPISNGESGLDVRTSLNSVIDVINGDAAASDVVGVPLTTGITGTLLVAHGGTGDATLTAHGVLMGAGTSAIAASAAGTAGQAFLSGGASANGAYGALDISTAAVTGVLPIANGGTGSAPLTGSTTYDPPSLLTLTQDIKTISVTGAVVGDFVLVSFSHDLAGITATGYVSASDTVSVVFSNGTSGTVDLASGTLSVRVFHTS